MLVAYHFPEKMGEFLTNEQIQSFHQNGLLVVDNFLSQDEVKDMRGEILKLVQEMDPKQHRGVFSTTVHHQVLQNWSRPKLFKNKCF